MLKRSVPSREPTLTLSLRFVISFSQKKSSPSTTARPKFHSALRPTGPVASMPAAPATRFTKSKSSSLRRGKWTAEEEAYVARVIQDFNSGFLNAPAGTTLRSYLSEKLHCDPMRITKKFTGDSCIGKRVFHPVVRCSSNAAAIDKAQVSTIRSPLCDFCWHDVYTYNCIVFLFYRPNWTL